MTELYDSPVEDVEALVKAAGQYVRPSDDMRPRVLEAARMQCGERWARRCLRHMAVFILLLGFFNIAIWQRLDDEQSRPNKLAAGFQEVFSPTPALSIRNGDGDWRMIDAFTKLRHQQAQLLRFEI